jgi:hypothetical protein
MKTKSQLEKEIKKARKVVNCLEFGTQDWEDAMQVVRSLSEKINQLTNFGEYTSIDGDIFMTR